MASKILCVDDSPTIRTLVVKALAPAGHVIVEAEHGKDALAKLSDDVDVFVVDVNMPVMDGFDFVAAVKQLPAHASKPVVFLTTESSTEKKARGQELGVNGWIVKPFEPAALERVISMITS